MWTIEVVASIALGSKVLTVGGAGGVIIPSIKELAGRIFTINFLISANIRLKVWDAALPVKPTTAVRCHR